MRPPPVTAALPSTTERAISRNEWLWLLGAVLFGAILRLSFPGRMAVEHFDEGVYASNFWFEVEQGGEYPARHLYAPPLLPLAIEWTMIVASLCGIKPTGFIPMIPSLIAGLATIPSMWWVGRRWFGPSAGIVAAWLVAASDFHASYSRAALTDVPVCLFMLWGVYFFWLALQTGTRRDILLAGLFTGLAWWTKYNGWLPLAIGLSGGAAWQLSLPRADRRLRQFATRWSLVALTAFAFWSPVLWGLQKHGGYAAVAANHRQYVVGLSGWGPAALRQLTHVGLYDNWFGVFAEMSMVMHRDRMIRQLKAEAQPELMSWQQRSPPEPIRAIDLLARHQMSNEDGVARITVWTVTGDLVVADALTAVSLWLRLLQSLVVATPLVFLLVGSITYVCVLIWRRSEFGGAATWIALAWLAGMTLATPLYRPYPRLVLPWLMGCWIGVALALRLLRDRRSIFGFATRGSAAAWRPAWVELSVIGWLVVCESTRCGMGTAHAWQDRNQVKTVGTQIAARIQEETKTAGFPSDEAIVYVFGEPALVFALKASGMPLVAPSQDLGFLAQPQPRPTFLVRTNRAFRSATFRKEWDRHRNDFQPVAMPTIHESDLVHFDEWDDFDKLSLKMRNGETVWVGLVRR